MCTTTTTMGTLSLPSGGMSGVPRKSESPNCFELRSAENERLRGRTLTGARQTRNADVTRCPSSQRVCTSTRLLTGNRSSLNRPGSLESSLVL